MTLQKKTNYPYLILLENTEIETLSKGPRDNIKIF